MEELPNDEEEKVGYKKPPKKNQFPPGKSGNPKGRPAKDSIHKMFVEILNEHTELQMGGEKIDMTKKEIILHQMVNKAMKGKTSHLKLFFAVLKDLTNLPSV